jgi:hypothetical protein
VLIVFEINRMSALIRPRQAFVNWVNEHCEDKSDELTLEEIEEDCTIFLIPAFETESEAYKYIETIYEDIFEMELSSWFEDPSIWPTTLSYKVFCEFFTVEIHSLVLDTVGYDMLESEHGSTTIQ